MAKDLRIEKSEQAIEQAFLELIEEKGFSNVHLIDIAKKANVNRNTIYLRYGTKEDIISSIVTKTFQKQFRNFSEQDLISVTATRRSTERLLTGLFEVLSGDIELYRIILTDQNLSGYLEKSLRAIRKVLMTHLEDTKKNKLVVEYLLQGVYGVIKNWIIYDTGSINENVRILTSLVVSNARHLSFKR